jgi:hypothetical protein
VSTQLAQIAKKAKLDQKVRFTSLAHLLTPEFLKETWGMINRRGASGIDGCQFAASCSHPPGDFFKMMQPPDFQGHAATRERDMIIFFRIMQPGAAEFFRVMPPPS